MIALKSGMCQAGKDFNTPTANVRIEGVVARTRDACFCTGSEDAAGTFNVTGAQSSPHPHLISPHPYPILTSSSPNPHLIFTSSRSQQPQLPRLPERHSAERFRPQGKHELLVD